MPAPTKPSVEDDLDPLPPVDGDEGEVESDASDVELEVDEREGDSLDDSTGEGDPVEPIDAGGEERGWLDDAAAEDVDVGGHDFHPEEDSLLRDVDEPGIGDEDFDLDDSSVSLDDAGEEGFDSDHEELREEDLPRMDADSEHGDGEDVARFWGGGEPEMALPPWDDRAWERIAHLPDVGTVRAIALAESDVIASGVLCWRVTLDEEAKASLERLDEGQAPALPELVATERGVYSLRQGRLCRAEGERWLPVEGLAGATAITAADGGLLVALHSEREDRAWIARVGEDESARVVAELGGEDEDCDPKVLCVAWDAARKIAWAGGAFGVIAFRPSGKRSSDGALKEE